jgi:hypothetical protein
VSIGYNSRNALHRIAPPGFRVEEGEMHHIRILPPSSAPRHPSIGPLFAIEQEEERRRIEAFVAAILIAAGLVALIGLGLIVAWADLRAWAMGLPAVHWII